MNTAAFESLRAAAIAAGAEARTELVADLLGLSAEELAHHDPKVWSQLDPEGRERLLAGVAGSAPVPPAAQPQAPHVLRTLAIVASGWRSWPPVAHAMTAGVATWAACILVAFASLIRFTPPSEPWDGRYAFCKRLDDVQAHCVYRVQAGLSWADAASRSSVDLDTLRHSNPSLVGLDIPAGALLRIDRPSAPPVTFDDLTGRHPGSE